eukprot:218210_1
MSEQRYYWQDWDNDYDEDEWDLKPIIMDMGSSMIKCGFSAEDAPRMVFPTTVGRPRHRGVMVGMGRKDAYVGDEALAKRGILRLINPIDYGHVTNWDDLEKIWHHAFYNELRVAPEEHAVFLADKIPNDKKVNREKITQIMFETFNTPYFYISLQSQLSLFGAGLLTGISVDLGYNVSYSIPYIEGELLENAITTTDIGGNDITNYWKETLKNNNEINMVNGFQGNVTKNKWKYVTVGDDIKHKDKFLYTKVFPEFTEKAIEDYTVSGYLRKYSEFDLYEYRNLLSNDVMSLCYRFYDDKKIIASDYILPDGKTIYFNEYERTECVECLFKPSLLLDKKKSTEIGIPEMCYQTIEKCKDIDREDKKKLYENIVVFGGTSMIENIEYRLEREINMKLQSSDDDKINVVVNSQKYAAWYGASVLTSLSTFENLWITKNTYDEIGPRCVHECGKY